MRHFVIILIFNYSYLLSCVYFKENKMGRNKILFALQRAPPSPSAVTLPLSQDTEVNETTSCNILVTPDITKPGTSASDTPVTPDITKILNQIVLLFWPRCSLSWPWCPLEFWWSQGQNGLPLFPLGSRPAMYFYNSPPPSCVTFKCWYPLSRGNDNFSVTLWMCNYITPHRYNGWTRFHQSGAPEVEQG